MHFFLSKEKYLKYFFPIVLFAWGLIQFFFGEQIVANQGLGWDGFRYASLTQYLTESPELDDYTVYRVFLPALINLISTLFSFAVSAKNIIVSFHVIHLILLPISGYFFVSIMEHYNLKTQTKLLGIILCYINFAILRFTHYYPVMMDTVAFSLAIIIFYLFLKQKTFDYMLLGCIGAFIFPTLFLQALFLFLFSKPFEFKADKKIIFISLTVFFILLQYVLLKSNMLDNDVLYSLKVQENYFFISALITAVLSTFFIYVFFSVNVKSFLIDFFSKENVSKIVVALTLIIVVALVAILLNVHEKKSEYLNATLILFKFFITGNTMPGISVVAHTTYFGVIVFIIALFWKSWLVEANSISSGLLIVCLLILFKVGIGSESRAIINILPFLIFPLLLVLNKININFWSILSLFVSNVFISKIWLKLNGEGNCEIDQYGTLGFPCQAFLMHLGPWMSYNAYWLQLIFFFIFAIIILLIFRKKIFNHGKQ